MKTEPMDSAYFSVQARAPWQAAQRPEDVDAGRTRRCAAQPPEDVLQCLQCLRPECVNCLAGQKSAGGTNGRPRKITGAVEELALQLLRAGRSNASIARAIGCKRDTVVRWRKRRSSLPPLGEGGTAAGGDG